MRSDFGMLIARTIIGGAMAAHGAQKAFGWFEGSGPQKTAGFMKMLGFEDPERMGTTAAYNELISGSLIAAGFLGTAGPSILTVNMIVAMLAVHKDNGFFAADNGIEVPLIYAAAALAFAAGGYGDCSLDRLLGIDGFFAKRRWFYLGMTGAVAATIAVMSQRRPTQPPSDQTQQTAPEPSPQAAA